MLTSPAILIYFARICSNPAKRIHRQVNLATCPTDNHPDCQALYRTTVSGPLSSARLSKHPQARVKRTAPRQRQRGAPNPRSLRRHRSRPVTTRRADSLHHRRPAASPTTAGRRIRRRRRSSCRRGLRAPWTWTPSTTTGRTGDPDTATPGDSAGNIRARMLAGFRLAVDPGQKSGARRPLAPIFVGSRSEVRAPRLLPATTVPPGRPAFKFVLISAP